MEEKKDMIVSDFPTEEKKRFRVLCAKEEKTSAQMISALMDFFEGKQ